MKFPKVEKKPRERIILTLEEWQQVIDRFPAGSRFHLPLMIGFYTGLRISEAFALMWDDKTLKILILCGLGSRLFLYVV